MIDDTLILNVKKAEGLRLEAYRDSVGVLTIGYGTNLEELTITESQAEGFLLDKLIVAEQEAQRFPWYAALSDDRKRAIIELMYNLGWPRLQKFVKFLAAMKYGDYETARLELLSSLWAAQVGKTRSERIADAILNG